MDISRISARTSAGTPGRPVRCRLFHVQNRRKPRRCQASTVAGSTTWSAALHPCHRCDSHAHSTRSRVVKRIRGRRERVATANWCRSARISRCSTALNRIVPLGERHLRRALAEYVAHYHGERNHQGLENELIDCPPRQRTRGPVRRRQRIGGILSHYYQSAAQSYRSFEFWDSTSERPLSADHAASDEATASRCREISAESSGPDPDRECETRDTAVPLSFACCPRDAFEA